MQVLTIPDYAGTGSTVTLLSLATGANLDTTLFGRCRWIQIGIIAPNPVTPSTVLPRVGGSNTAQGRGLAIFPNIATLLPALDPTGYTYLLSDVFLWVPSGVTVAVAFGAY